MSRLPLLVPILFILYVAIGLAEPKTIAVSTAFALFIVWGIKTGEGLKWVDRGLEIDDEYINWAFWGAIVIIFLQIAILKKIPLLDPAIRTHLNPDLTALTYFLGVPSSVYIFMRGRKYSLLYPLAVALYAYRTPVLASIIAMGAAYYENTRRAGKIEPIKLAAILGGGTVLIILMTILRGNALSSLWVRFQSTVSVLDVIIWRGNWAGTYHGTLQWLGVTSYLTGGYSPRGFIARFIYIHTGVTITPTLLGGMYLDFGIFAVVEGFLLGLYYGMISNAEHPITKALYYSTLSYGVIGVETGLLDLPVYGLFLAGAYILYRGTLGNKGCQ